MLFISSWNGRYRRKRNSERLETIARIASSHSSSIQIRLQRGAGALNKDITGRQNSIGVIFKIPVTQRHGGHYAASQIAFAGSFASHIGAVLDGALTAPRALRIRRVFCFRARSTHAISPERISGIVSFTRNGIPISAPPTIRIGRHLRVFLPIYDIDHTTERRCPYAAYLLRSARGSLNGYILALGQT